MTTGDHYIANRWVSGQGPAFQSNDPGSGQVIWDGHAASDAQVCEAVNAAGQAWPAWADTPLPQRVALLQSFGEQLTEHQNALAITISKDTGKPLWESRTEVGAMIGKIKLSLQAYEQRCHCVSHDLNGAKAVTRFKPHGVCAVLGPYNLPGHLPNGHIVPALLAGNTVVFKPSELSAAVGQHMLELWHASGLPTGVMNMVQGGRQTAVSLSTHPQLDGLFFTGSYAVGCQLSQALAAQPQKILALEMGGNNPLVVWDASDHETAAYMTVQSAFVTAGQRCTCARRLIVPANGQGQAFVDCLVRLIADVRTGLYHERPEPFMGPVISRQAADRLLEAQRQLIDDRGGVSIVPMKASPQCPALLTPGLVDVTAVNQRTDEELFGPLLQVIRVENFDDAVREANHTMYGLSAGLFSDRRPLYEQFYRSIRAGVVNWNRQTTGASGLLPFGGVGASGNHRPAGYWSADYCSFPVASIEHDQLTMPTTPTPGVGS